MTTPYDVLKVSPDADDEAVRRAYLAAVRDHPPERDPAGFQAARAAYEAIRTAEDRVRLVIYNYAPPDEPERIAAELPRGRVRLRQFISAYRVSRELT